MSYLRFSVSSPKVPISQYVQTQGKGDQVALRKRSKPVAFDVDAEGSVEEEPTSETPVEPSKKHVQPEKKGTLFRLIAEAKAAEAGVTVAPVQVPVKKELKSVDESPLMGGKGVSKEKCSLFALAAKKPVSNMKANPDDKGEEADLTEVDEPESKKGPIFVRKQVEIPTVNPQNNSVASVSATTDVGAKAPMAPSATISELINQLLKELTTMTVGDKTETTIVLKHPPLLDGAQVVMTGFDSAKGELNIKFANLTQQAQALIEQQQQSLLAALEIKGYHVHIFIATTVSEPQIIAAGAQPSDKERQQRQEEGQGRFKEEREE